MLASVLPEHDHAGPVHLEGQQQRAVDAGLDESTAPLVDRDPEIFDLLDVEPGGTADAAGDQPGQASPASCRPERPARWCLRRVVLPWLLRRACPNLGPAVRFRDRIGQNQGMAPPLVVVTARHRTSRDPGPEMAAPQLRLADRLCKRHRPGRWPSHGRAPHHRGEHRRGALAGRGRRPDAHGRARHQPGRGTARRPIPRCTASTTAPTITRPRCSEVALERRTAGAGRVPRAQLLNVVLGGSLVQDLPGPPEGLDHGGPASAARPCTTSTSTRAPGLAEAHRGPRDDRVVDPPPGHRPARRRADGHGSSPRPHRRGRWNTATRPPAGSWRSSGTRRTGPTSTRWRSASSTPSWCRPPSGRPSRPSASRQSCLPDLTCESTTASSQTDGR